MKLKLRYKVGWIVMIVAVICVLGAVLAPDTPEREVTVYYPKIVASLPHFVAMKQGLYEKNHLKVISKPIRSSPDMVDAVDSGKCDFLPAISLVNAVNASVDKDCPLLTIVSHSRMRKDVPFDCLLVTAGSRLASLKDLEGCKLGVWPGGTSEASVKWYLNSVGVDISKISFVTALPREQIDMLLAGRVDAVHAYEPQRTLGILQYKCRPLSPSIYAAISEPASIGCTAVATRVFLEDPEKAKDILMVWDEAVDFIRTHEIEARNILADELGYTVEVAQACTWVDVTKSSEMDHLALIRFVDVLREIEPPQIRVGLLPKGLFYGKE